MNPLANIVCYFIRAYLQKRIEETEEYLRKLCDVNYYSVNGTAWVEGQVRTKRIAVGMLRQAQEHCTVNVIAKLLKTIPLPHEVLAHGYHDSKSLEPGDGPIHQGERRVLRQELPVDDS